MKKYIVSAVLSFGILASPTFTQAAGLTTGQANSLIAVVQAAPGIPASAFVNLITAFSNITANQATSLIAVVQSAPGVAPNAFVNLLISFTSDTTTTQTTPSVTTLSPNGGEVWETGKNYEFKWKSQGEGQIIINLDNVDTGVRYGTLDAVSGVDAIAGTASWTVPSLNLPAGRYKAVITGYNTGVSDSGDSYFTIVTAPTVSVLSPNGGESYSVNAMQPIVSLKVQIKDFKQKGNLNLYFTTRNDTDWKFGANYLVHSAIGVDNINFNPYIDSSTMGLSVPGAGPQYAPGKYYLYAEWTGADGTVRGDFSDSYFILTSN